MKKPILVGVQKDCTETGLGTLCVAIGQIWLFAWIKFKRTYSQIATRVLIEYNPF